MMLVHRSESITASADFGAVCQTRKPAMSSRLLLRCSRLRAGAGDAAFDQTGIRGQVGAPVAGVGRNVIPFSGGTACPALFLRQSPSVEAGWLTGVAGCQDKFLPVDGCWLFTARRPAPSRRRPPLLRPREGLVTGFGGGPSVAGSWSCGESRKPLPASSYRRFRRQRGAAIIMLTMLGEDMALRVGKASMARRSTAIHDGHTDASPLGEVKI